MPGSQVFESHFEESKNIMNNQDDKKIEEIVGQVLQYIDDGKTPAEIFDLFPDYREELKEVFFAVDFIKKEGGKIYPDKEIFRQVMARIPANVTNEHNPRYSFMKEVQGRPSLRNMITKIQDLMTINWKVWAPVGIVAVVALVLVGNSQLGTKAPQAPVAEESTQAPIAAPTQELPVAVTKPATGNVDDAVNAILAAVSDDQALFADVEKDAALVAADSQAISDFGQSYNENEF